MKNSGQPENIDLITVINFFQQTIKIRRTIENSPGRQSDPAGNVIHLSNKHFTKDVYKHQNKNVNSQLKYQND